MHLGHNWLRLQSAVSILLILVESRLPKEWQKERLGYINVGDGKKPFFFKINEILEGIDFQQSLHRLIRRKGMGSLVAHDSFLFYALPRIIIVIVFA